MLPLSWPTTPFWLKKPLASYALVAGIALEQGASGRVTSPVVQTLWLDTTRFVVCEPTSIFHRSPHDKGLVF